MLINVFAFAANNNGENPIITKFSMSNFELLNLDNGNYKFKKIHCSDGGYSFFSPYYVKPDLISSTINSNKKDNEIEITIKGEKEETMFSISNFSVSDDKSVASFDIKKGNFIYPSKIFGTNLSTEYIKNSFSEFNNTPVLSQGECPWCVVAIVVAAAIAEACENAQSSCTPCNGTLTVGSCSCSCKPIP